MRKRFLVALAAAATLALLPSAAWAHNPLIEGTLDCDGVLTFKATAWEGTHGEDHEASRTNPDIRITLHAEGGPEEGVEIAKGAFNKDNDFSFGGTHDLGLTEEELTIRATAKAAWANGAQPGEAHEAKVKLPTGCTTTTSSSSSSSTTTSTTQPEDTTTTTQPEDTTTTTLPEETTTTVTPTTVPPTTTPPSDEGQLPFTGAGTAPILLSIAAGLIAAGGTAVYLARRRSGAGAES
jgi:LPXTG cell wall anchor motif